jgi:hypothetical protein
MKSTSKEVASKGSRKAQPPELAESMVDALEDILRWERTSERKLKAEKAANTTTVPADGALSA